MKNNLIIKICGIKNEAVARQVIKYKPSMIGLNFVQRSPRYIDNETARKISILAHSYGISVVGIFQNQPIKLINDLTKSLELDYVQLHGDETIEYCKKIKSKIIKKILLGKSIEETKLMIRTYKKNVAFFLIDRMAQGKGPIVDLSQVKELAKEYPIILGGGLNIKNIIHVIEQVGIDLYGVDISSGIEYKPGYKSERLVKLFIENARKNKINAHVCAIQLDGNNPFRRYKKEFFMPPNSIYMDGNSLGLFSKQAEQSLYEIVKSYKKYGIDGWLKGDNPWFYLAEKIGGLLAPLVGALPEEVVIANSTSVNLHQLIATFYKPKDKRTKILVDEFIFPTDMYAVKSQLVLRGIKPEHNLIVIKSRNKRLINEDDIISNMTDEVALILLPTVIYHTGQLFDVKKLTNAAHERGIIIGFDACHSIGTIPHQFHNDNVDFAFFCTYKYLNGGPGSPAGLFVHQKHFGTVPALAGWFSSRKDAQFNMSPELVPATGAGAFQIGTPPIFSLAPLIGALNMIHAAGISEIRKKSLDLTDYLIDLIESELSDFGFTLATPIMHEKRGGHVAIQHRDAARICKSLKKHGIIPDFRPPNIIRIAPIPFYNSYRDVYKVVQIIKKIMLEKDYYKFENKRELVA